MRTIRKNAHKQIATIFAGALSCKVYTLENGFTGERVSIEAAERTLETKPYARLTESGTGKYTLRVHSNRWYEILSS